MNEAQIKYLVDRFLGWTLPTDFQPDGNIQYNRPVMATKGSKEVMPSGTNLFDASQATEMLLYMIDGMPVEPVVAAPAPQVMSDKEAADIINRCIGEITQLRNEIAFLQPKAEAYNHISQVLSMVPRNSQCMGEDLVWRLKDKLGELQPAK